MAKNSKPRKTYRPKPVNVPVTQGLLDDLAQDMHFALMGMESNDNSPDNWKKLGRVIFVVALTADDNERVGFGDKVLLDSAVLTLKAISDREERTKVWTMTEADRSSLINGAIAAENIIPLLDYRKLSEANRAFRAYASAI